MTLPLVAALLPVLFWDGGPQTASALRDAHIDHIFVPQSALKSWKSVPGITVEPADPQRAVRLVTPSVNFRMFDATATQAPWINSNGWRYLRHPGARCYVEAPGAAAALAAAEAFVFGGNTMIHTDAAGLQPLAAMLDFSRKLDPADLHPLANIGFIDDGSPTSGERMNMMVVRNLLLEPVTAPDPSLALTVRVGSTDYPDAAWHNPDLLEHVIRSKLTDEKRLVRVYGSDVVIARLAGAEDHVRVHLLNYATARHRVGGLRVRVLGKFASYKVHASGDPDAHLADFAAESDVTEFTLPELRTYAVVDLSR